MHKLLRPLAAALLILSWAPGVVGHASAAAAQPKVAIVVGAVQGTTASYRADGDAAASSFARYTSNIVKVYSPNATWSAVQAAAQGASVLVYIGHGSGYPNPYVSYLQPNADNGMGLNYSDGSKPQSDSYTKYYGENYMATLNLAPNAVVLLWHLCYASGDSEWGSGVPSLATAKTRIDGYASGFLRGNARAVIADGVAGSLNSYIDGIFAGHTTIDQVWKSADTFHNHVSGWDSSRNAGFLSQMDPSLDSPAPDGDPYYRSMVAYPGLKTDDIGVDSFVPPAPSTYYPITPTRILDTRDGSGGLAGPFEAGHARTFAVTGGVVPGDATAVTGNLTVTQQSTKGWLYIGPEPLDAPTSSMLNFPAGDNRANNVTVQLGTHTQPGNIWGTLSITYGAPAGSTAHVVFDVTGYFKADQGGATYHPLEPARVVDSRINLGIAGALASMTPKGFQVVGAGGVPDGAIAVTGNLTVTQQTSKGYFYIGPVETGSPSSSTLNFPVGDNRANGVTATLASGKLFVTFVGAGYGPTAHVVFDVTGYYTAGLDGASYVPLPPTRILDTRYGIGLVSAFSSQSARSFGVMNMGHVAPTAVAVTGNLTVTQQTLRGFLYVGPTRNDHPGSSTLNFPTGDNRSNGVTVQLGSGALGVTYVAPKTGPTAHVIFDVTGYFK